MSVKDNKTNLVILGELRGEEAATFMNGLGQVVEKMKSEGHFTEISNEQIQSKAKELEEILDK